MDPATLIGIGSTLLGGLFAPKPKYVVPDYAKIRSGAEAAGFNPLTALTQGPAGQVVQPENYMGNAIANAGLMLADNMTKTARASRLQKLQGDNEKLQEKVQRLTLQPKVGGVYARRESVPTLGAALGRANAGSGSQTPSASSLGEGASFGVAASDPIKPDLTHTYKTFANDGQVTNVPLGPDLDEVISGAFIAANNYRKAEDVRRSRMTFGQPLSMRDGIQMPPGYVPSWDRPKPPGMTKGRAYRYGSVGQDGYALREPPLFAF